MDSVKSDLSKKLITSKIKSNITIKNNSDNTTNIQINNFHSDILFWWLIMVLHSSKQTMILASKRKKI